VELLLSAAAAAGSGDGDDDDAVVSRMFFKNCTASALIVTATRATSRC